MSEDYERTVQGTGTTAEALTLYVFSGGLSGFYPLPKSGIIKIGRSDHCEVRLDDQQASRQHAEIRVLGSAVYLTDLDSANGTRLDGRPLPPGTRETWAAGVVAAIGGSLLVLHTAPKKISRRYVSHEYFEARLLEECDQAGQEKRRAFSLVRVRAADGDDGALREALGGLLGPRDVAGVYLPGDLELFIDGSRERVALLREQVEQQLPEDDFYWTVASWPHDGRNAYALMQKVSENQPKKPAQAVIAGDALRRLDQEISALASGPIRILLEGESGVGKEVFAREIHHRSQQGRKKGEFIAVNCAALPEQTFESELFGHKKGAFTGADSDKVGLIEAAHDGTLFLDEIGEMPLDTQAKLLRAIESGQIRRLGENKEITVRVRYLSATNRNLLDEVQAGRFRKDLYYRLAEFPLRIPPLRERRDEIIPLSEHFLRLHAESLHLAQVPVLSEASRALLTSYSWPGNIREVRSALLRAVYLVGKNGVIEPQHLPLETMRAAVPSGASETNQSLLEHHERDRIAQALQQHGGNQTQAARALGISDKTLRAKMDKYGMKRPRK